MDFFEAVEKRHSYRGAFEPGDIPAEHLTKILDAGLRAPSGLNTQTTSFVVVKDKALREGISQIFPHKGLATAPAIVAVLSEYVEVYRGAAYEVQDYSAAIENILLAATALGYASVWIEGESQQDERPAKIARLLNLPEGKSLRVLLPLGVPLAPGTQKEKKPFEERVTIL